jgi:hypothetical protein
MISAEVAHYAANLVRKTMIDFVNIKFDSSSPGGDHEAYKSGS